MPFSAVSQFISQIYPVLSQSGALPYLRDSRGISSRERRRDRWADKYLARDSRRQVPD
jgi:hypothetical protein